MSKLRAFQEIRRPSSFSSLSHILSRFLSFEMEKFTEEQKVYLPFFTIMEMFFANVKRN